MKHINVLSRNRFERVLRGHTSTKETHTHTHMHIIVDHLHWFVPCKVLNKLMQRQYFVTMCLSRVKVEESGISCPSLTCTNNAYACTLSQVPGGGKGGDKEPPWKIAMNNSLHQIRGHSEWVSDGDPAQVLRGLTGTAGYDISSKVWIRKRRLHTVYKHEWIILNHHPHTHMLLICWHPGAFGIFLTLARGMGGVLPGDCTQSCTEVQYEGL